MHVTVAICTWNRARMLDRTLSSFRAVYVPSHVRWRLVVVNNACSDDTDAVIGRHAGALPVQREFEPRAGVSYARDRAVAAAAGSGLMACTDDDVVVDPGWLAAYVAAAERWPSAAFFGGKASPLFEEAPPSWVTANLETLGYVVAARDFGPDERPLAAHESPFGLNMAMRPSALAGWTFDPAFGITGSERRLGEETALFRWMRQRGHQGVWVPSAAVAHVIPPARLRRDALWKDYVARGRSAAAVDGCPPGPRLFGAPRWAHRRVAELWLRSTVLRLAGRSGWLRPYLDAAWTRGVAVECRAAAARRPR